MPSYSCHPTLSPPPPPFQRMAPTAPGAENLSAQLRGRSYFLTLTSCQPLYGKLSDIFGRKECLLFAYAVFGVGCLGCDLAQNMLQLCAFRALAGIGGGGMNSVVAILFSDIVPLRDRGVWQGYTNIIFAAGTSTGAPLGGFAADSLGWRWYGGPVHVDARPAAEQRS